MTNGEQRTVVAPKRWREELGPVSAQLGAFVARSEEEFVTFGAGLQDGLEGAGRLSRAARSAVDAISGEAIEAALAGFRTQAAALEEHARAGADRGQRMDERLSQTLGHLRAIPAHGDAFQRAVRSLRALGVATHIESARLGARGEGFTTLALDVRELAEQVNDKCALVLEHSGALEQEMTTALGSVLEAQRTLQEELGEVLEGLGRGFEELVEVNRRARGASTRVEAGSAELSGRIGEILASMQFQDITRQRLEHVCESLVRLEGELTPEEIEAGGPERAAALTAGVIGLQRSQLDHADREFFGAVSGILEILPGLAQEGDALSREIVELTATAGAGGGSCLEELHRNLAAVVTTVRRMAEQNGELSSLLSSAARRAGEITSFIEDIDEIGSDIELIAFNAIVQSSRTGTDGRPLAVIAQAIQRQSVDARRITGRVSGALREIGTAAQELEELAKGFGATEREEAHQVLEELEALLGSLAAADREFRNHVEGLAAESLRLREGLEQSGRCADLHHRLRALSVEVGARLARIEEQAQALYPEGSAEHEAVLRELAAHYTMESQRAVHRGFTGDVASAVPTTGGADLGANVELF